MSGTGKIVAIAKAVGASASAISQEVEKQLPGAVDDWLDEHITNPSSPPLDTSLSLSNAAAPADKAGAIKSDLKDLNDDVNGEYADNFTTGKKITADNSTYSFDDDANTCVSELISITWGWDTSTNIRFYYNNAQGDANYYYKIIYFDENKNYLGQKGSYGNDYRAVTNVSGGKYVQFAFRKGTTGKLVQNLAPNTVYWESSNSLVTPGLVQKIGDLTNLETTNKNSIVSAVNEVNTAVGTAVSSITNKVDKDGTAQIKVKNCEFVQPSPNLFNVSTIETGLLNKNNGELLTNYTDYRTSDWIEIDAETAYTLGADSEVYAYYCFYNSSKAYISGTEKSVNTALTVTSPANAKYFRFSMTSAQVTKQIQFEKGSEQTGYMKFEGGYIKPEYLAQPEMFPLNLPKKIYGLVGYETNVYFDNLVEGSADDYEWNVDGSVGMQMERCYRITPTTAGTYTIRFRATRKKDGSSVLKNVSFVVAGTSAGSGESKSIIVLGDSTTNSGTVIQKLHANLSEDVMTVATDGTRGTSPNNHEGRDGWKFEYYCTEASHSSVANPFYNSTSQAFDAGYYFTNTSVPEPDYFFVNLGINDMFSADNDDDLETAITQTVAYCDGMIESIKAASSDINVVICLTIPPNCSQDAFGKEYKCGQTQARYKRNNILWVRKLIEKYDGKESDGIYVLAINAALDTKYNMGLETIPVNARNTSITYESPVGNGGVHPVESGYWQIADVYTAFLKANA